MNFSYDGITPFKVSRTYIYWLHRYLRKCEFWDILMTFSKSKKGHNFEKGHLAFT